MTDVNVVERRTAASIASLSEQAYRRSEIYGEAAMQICSDNFRTLLLKRLNVSRYFLP